MRSELQKRLEEIERIVNLLDTVSRSDKKERRRLVRELNAAITYLKYTLGV